MEKPKNITVEYESDFEIDTELDNDLVKFFFERHYLLESQGYDLEKKTRDLAFVYYKPLTKRIGG